MSSDGAEGLREAVNLAAERLRESVRPRQGPGAFAPIPNDQAGLHISFGEVDDVLRGVRMAGGTPESIADAAQKLSELSGGKLNAQSLISDAERLAK